MLANTMFLFVHKLENIELSNTVFHVIILVNFLTITVNLNTFFFLQK